MMTWMSKDCLTLLRAARFATGPSGAYLINRINRDANAGREMRGKARIPATYFTSRVCPCFYPKFPKDNDVYNRLDMLISHRIGRSIFFVRHRAVSLDFAVSSLWPYLSGRVSVRLDLNACGVVTHNCHSMPFTQIMRLFIALDWLIGLVNPKFKALREWKEKKNWPQKTNHQTTNFKN